MFSPRSSNDISDNEDEQNNLALRRKYLKTQQTNREQQLPPSPTLRCASNGVPLRPKPQQHSVNVLPISSNDMSKKFKRFSLDQQLAAEPTVYRSSMAIVPNHPVQMNNNNQSPSTPFKAVRDQLNGHFQQLNFFFVDTRNESRGNP